MNGVESTALNGEGGKSAIPTLPYERLRRSVLVAAGAMLLMALFLGFLIESLRADQYTLSFEAAGLPVSFTEIDHNHGRLVRDCSVLTVLGLGVFAFWLVWQFRSTANLRVLVPGMRFTPVVGLVGWLVPVINVVVPPLALRELWKAGDLYKEKWRKVWTIPLLWAWWLLLLASLTLTVWALAPAFHANPTLEELMIRDHRGVIAAGIGILAMLTWAILLLLFDFRVGMKEVQVSGKWRGWAQRGLTAGRS